MENTHAHDGQTHTHGSHDGHHHDEVMEVYEGEALRVRFIGADGAEYTVHFRDRELRVCGKLPLVARQRHMDVVGISGTPAKRNPAKRNP